MYDNQLEVFSIEVACFYCKLDRASNMFKKLIGRLSRMQIVFATNILKFLPIEIFGYPSSSAYIN